MEREFVIVANECSDDGSSEQFGGADRHGDETLVIMAETPEQALAKAVERYGLNPDEWGVEEVMIIAADNLEFSERATCQAVGICTFLPAASGRRAVAVFDISCEDSDDAKLLGFLDRDGQLVDEPHIFEAGDDEAIIDVTSRLWPYAGQEGFGHMVTGEDFAREIAAS